MNPENNTVFTLMYFMFSFCLIFPIPVFIQCGLTVESLFSKFLGDEEMCFTAYHLRRTVAVVILHSCLPLGYAVGRVGIDGELWGKDSLLWQMYLVGSCTLPVLAALQMVHWASNNWYNHPICSKLRKFAPNQDFRQLAKDIDSEYRGSYKLVIKCDPTSKVVVTANWILKTSLYSLDLAHQSDVSLQIVAADEHTVALDSPGGVQYLQIRVESSRANVLPFFVRINSTNLKDLQDRITLPIRVLEDVQVHSTIKDRFLVAFKNQVKENPTVTLEHELTDMCWGCSEKVPNVMLMKTCGDDEGPNHCSSCYCRPMWCIDCMGIWFASRQDQDRPDRWMSSKCTCPLCRSTFCVLDVCYVSQENIH